MSPALQWTVFSAFSAVAILGALGMTTTMSMFRSGVFLMASFVGVAGLFVLLLADLLGLLQVMMYVGGMLVMILFMLLFSSDPGGERMATHMQLGPIERLFSLGLRRSKDEVDHAEAGMMTPIKAPAAWLALATGVILVGLLVLRPAWPVIDAVPDTDGPRRIGQLLMGRYMVAFEGAGALILLGIFGAVYVARTGRHPDPSDRAHIAAAVDAPPPDIEEAP